MGANDDYPGKSDYSAIVSHLYDLKENDTLWIQIDGSQDGMRGYFYLKVNPYVISSIKEPVINKLESDLIYLYPNPNDGTFTLQIRELVRDPYIINIYNISGQKVFEKEYSLNKENINIRHLEKGIYFLEFTDKTQKSVKKIIIQ